MSIEQNQHSAAFPQNSNILKVTVQTALFSREECLNIIKLQEDIPAMEGLAGLKDYASDSRDSRVKWLSSGADTQWIYQRIEEVAREKNNLYQFRLAGFREPFQVASYSGNGYFNWHVDLGYDITSTRKLSISVQLSDGSDYDGGNLEFWDMGDVQIPKTIGAVIIFPSYLLHRVTPVTQGSRRSLVAWVHGPSFQ